MPQASPAGLPRLRFDQALTNPLDKFANLLWTMRRALALAHKMVAANRESEELRDLLFQSRRLLTAMRQRAASAPEDERDSLVELCEAIDRSLCRLEHYPASTKAKNGA